MKVVAISGSPRDGNTDALLYEVIKGARKKGAETVFLKLREHDIQLCNGCDLCVGKEEECWAIDDWIAIEKDILEADAWVIGSPTYFSNVSALLKIFIDRTNPYWKRKSLKGKKLGIVCVGGAPMPSIKKCAATLKEFARIHKMKVAGTVTARADRKGEIAGKKKELEKAFALGKKMVKA